MIRGKFLAQDDFDLAGHRFLNWQWVEDIPTREGEEGEVLAIVDGKASWAVMSADGLVVVDWDDILNKPATFTPSSHTHPWTEVTDKPNFVNSVIAGPGISVSGATGDVTVSNSLEDDLTEPTGFINRTDSTMAFDEGTRTFTIAPVSSSFDVFVIGTRYTFTTAVTVTITDTEGTWFFYFDSSGTLVASQTFGVDTVAISSLCAVVYWDATNGAIVGMGEERHGLVMDGTTHAYLHLTRGTAVESGLGLGDIVADGSGDLAIHAQLSTASGVMWDEDIRLAITGATAPAQIPVLYQEGASGTWRAATANDYPVLPFPAGRLAYNQLVGATWQQTEVSNTDFMLMHIFATNSVSVPHYIAIQGQEIYTTKRRARAGAQVEIANLITTGLPTPEFAVVATVIFQTSSGYANAVKGRIVTTDEGDDYVNWVNVPLSPTSGPSNHFNLLNIGTYTHAEIDTHIDTVTGNPHVVTLAEVGGAAASHTHVASEVGAGTFGAGNFVFPSYVAVGADVRVDGNININYNNTGTYGNLYFHDGASTTGGYIRYRMSTDQFDISDTINVLGNINATGAATVDGIVISKGNLKGYTRLSVGNSGALGTGEQAVINSVDFYPDVPVNATNYYKNLVLKSNKVAIAAGVTDSGYRIGVEMDTFVNTADFAGTLDRQYSLWVRCGANGAAPTGTINTAVALYLNMLTSANVTIGNQYGIYQPDNVGKNYFKSPIGIGVDPSGTYKLEVVGDAKITGDLINASPTVPATAGATGTTGQQAWDSSYFYICVATDTWKRVAISTW